MDGLAMEWGISPARQQEAHREYLDCMVEAAKRDGFVSEAEHEILLRIATQLQGRHRNRSRTGHPQLHCGNRGRGCVSVSRVRPQLAAGYGRVPICRG